MCKIFIDADSSGNVKRIENVAKKHGIPVIMYCNGDHLIKSDYSEVRYVEKGKDVADFAIVNHCGKNDIVITKDYGLASMALAKQAQCITPNGAQYNSRNIDRLLYRRHMNKRYNLGKRSRAINVPDFKNIGIEKALTNSIKACFA